VTAARTRRARRIPAAAAALALAALSLAVGHPPVVAQQQQQQQGQQRRPVPLFPPAPPAPTPPAVAPAMDREAARPTPPEPSVRVQPLGPPGLDATGLPAPDGLADGDAIWAGSDPRLVLDLLERLPVRTANPALRALTRRLLASGGPSPPGEEGRPLGVRVRGLLAMGELDTALALLHRLPAGQGGEALERLAVEALLLAGDAAVACARGGDAAAGFRAAFWTKLTVLCRLRAGERAAAGLALELLREQAGREPPGGEADDPAFFALAGTALDAGGGAPGGGPPPPLPEAGAPPSPLHLALMREARLPVPGEPPERHAPEHLAAIARDPATPSARRVAAAERAAALGALPPDGLAAAYAAAADLAAGPIEAAAVAGLAGAPAGRARLYHALHGGGPPPAWGPEAVGAVWRAIDDPRLRPLLARLLAAPLADLPPAAGAGSAGAVLGLLALGRAGDAAAWWRPAADPPPLAALLALARGEAPDSAAAVAGWREVGPPFEGAETRLLALFEGLGTPVPEPVWRALLDGGGPEGDGAADAAPPPADAAGPWLRLRHAAPAGRVGEAVLSGLLLLDGRPELAHPAALADVLAGLRRVGLEREARAVALDAALTMGGRALATGARGDG
jgi:hypothetical protein